MLLTQKIKKKEKEKNGVTRKHYEDGSVEMVFGSSKWKTSEIKKRKIEYNV